MEIGRADREDDFGYAHGGGLAKKSHLWLNGFMNPEDGQNQQPPVYAGDSLEYLDQIAPKKPSRFQVIDKRVFIIGGLVLLTIIVAIVAAALSSSAPTPSGEVLGSRYSTLSELIKYGEGDKVNDSGLKKALAEAQVVTASSQYQLSQIVSLTGTSKTASNSDSLSTLTASLDRALSTGNFNKQYSVALVGQISQVILSLQEVRAKLTSSASITTVDQSIVNLTEISARLTYN
jgi:hypothetical protein